MYVLEAGDFMENGIEIELKPRRGATGFTFRFQLEKHHMAKKYVELVKRFKARGSKIDDLNSYWNFHLGEDSLLSLTQELQSRIDGLKPEPEIPMPYQVDTNVTQDQLNAIHGDFEKYLNLVNQGRLIPTNTMAAIENLLQINLLVHKIENYFRLKREVEAGNKEYISCNFGYRFENDEFFQLEDRDFDCFSAGSEFGDLFCGYNTTGKSFVHCYYDGDLELVRSKGVRPQRTFSTEGFLHFGPRASGEDLMEKLRVWWKENGIDQHGYQFDDKRNAYGLIRLGRLIEPDEFKGKTHWEKLQFLDQFDGVRDCRIIDGSTA